MGELLRVEDLQTWYHTRAGSVRAVDGVSLSLQQGRTLGLVGESGSGKSVTALSIMGLIDPPGRIQPSSRVLFEGIDLVKASEEAETLRLHRKIGSRSAQARAIDLLRQVSIPLPERRAREYPHQLSGGMRQRVMIAMAVACDPLLLIADEPTTALDVTIQAQILALMRDLRRRRNTAILLITHDLGVIAEMAQRSDRCHVSRQDRRERTGGEQEPVLATKRAGHLAACHFAGTPISGSTS